MDPTQPLGLPRGSVRAIIALLIVLTTCGLVALGHDISEAFLGLATAVVAFYFAGRNSAPNTPAA